MRFRLASEEHDSKLASEEENLGLAGCFQPPEGRRENSPGLQPWEVARKENRPERATDSWQPLNYMHVNHVA